MLLLTKGLFRFVVAIASMNTSGHLLQNRWTIVIDLTTSIVWLAWTWPEYVLSNRQTGQTAWYIVLDHISHLAGDRFIVYDRLLGTFLDVFELAGSSTSVRQLLHPLTILSFFEAIHDWELSDFGLVESNKCFVMKLFGHVSTCFINQLGRWFCLWWASQWVTQSNTLYWLQSWDEIEWLVGIIASEGRTDVNVNLAECVPVCGSLSIGVYCFFLRKPQSVYIIFK